MGTPEPTTPDARSLLAALVELHPDTTVRFVDDDGVQHPPHVICATCRKSAPCPTIALATVRLAAAPASGLREAVRDELTIAAQTTYRNEPKIAEGIRIARSIVWAALAAPAPAMLDVERLARALHFWCVEVDGEAALAHQWERHKAMALFVAAAYEREPK